MPTELDEVNRKIRTLEVEKAAFRKRTMSRRKKRLIDLNKANSQSRERQEHG
jgi:hypothetical protein